MKGQGYKLRLGDGTTFSVDEKGLMTWLHGGMVDSKARVQPDGSKKWYSVQQVLAASASTARRGLDRDVADKQAAAEAAAIEKKLAQDRAAEERKAAGNAAAAERRAAEEAAAEERRAADARAFEEARLAEEARAAREQEAERERVEAERRAAEEKAAAERAAAEAARVAEAERLAAEELAARKRQVEEQKAAAADRAAAERAERDRQVEAERQAAREREAERTRRAEAERQAERDRQAERERELEAGRRAEAERAARIAEAERLAAERLAAERKAEEKRLADERRAAEDAAALDAMAPFVPPATQIPLDPVAMAAEDKSFEGDLDAFHKELALVPVAAPDAADSPASAREGAPASRPGADDVPASAAPPSAPAQTGALASTAEALGSTAVRVMGAAAPMAAAAGEWIASAAHHLPSTRTLASLWTRATARLASLVPSRPAPEKRPAEADMVSAAALPAAAAPSTPPLAQPTPAPVQTAERPTTPAPVAPAPAPIRAAAATAPKAPAADPPRGGPPVSYKDLPVIPFADPSVGRRRVEPEEPEDVWDGDEPGYAPGVLATTWVWVKRATIAAALAVTAAILAMNPDAWLPRARSAALVLFQEVDRLTSKAVAPDVPPQAVEAASRQLPHLRPDTIELVMERSGRGGLEPVDVFRRAHDAAEQGRPALGEAASHELDTLTAMLASELPPPERARLRGYLSRVRARAVTASYEDQEAVWLLARAARGFPADRIARTQTLFAQAIAAGLPPAR